MTVAIEDLQELSSQTRALLAKLNPWAAQAPVEFRPTWAEHLERLTELAQFLEAGGAEPGPARTQAPVTAAQWMQFGRLLRDKRNAAGWSEQGVYSASRPAPRGTHPRGGDGAD